MRSPNPAPETIRGASAQPLDGQGSGAPTATGRGAGNQPRAALGPRPEPVSAAENPAPALSADSGVAAVGRRTLSTAFVKVGPDALLTVELRNGRVLVLRDVVMRPTKYCGVTMLGGSTGAQYCGGYAEVAAARPGGAPAPAAPDLAVSNPAKPLRVPAQRD